MNQIQLKVIRDALRKKPAQVNLNKTWEQLHHEHAIGVQIVNGLRLNDRDYLLLQQIYAQHRKDDVLHELPTQLNRLEAVNIHRNEKSTSKHVFADQLVCASVHHRLPLKYASLEIGYPTLVPTIDVSELNLSGITRLVVLENATMLITLHQWYQCLPEAWQSSLFIYRGQGQNQSQLKSLLAQLAPNIPVAIYADFDPSGLYIVMDYLSIRPVSIIIPKEWQHLSRHHSCNQSEIFLKQVWDQPHIPPKLTNHPVLSPIFMIMQSEKLALMQENVLLLNGLESVDL